jgi:hypothetical protein
VLDELNARDCPGVQEKKSPAAVLAAINVPPVELEIAVPVVLSIEIQPPT